MAELSSTAQAGVGPVRRGGDGRADGFAEREHAG